MSVSLGFKNDYSYEKQSDIFTENRYPAGSVYYYHYLTFLIDALFSFCAKKNNNTGWLSDRIHHITWYAIAEL